jgi:transposase
MKNGTNGTNGKTSSAQLQREIDASLAARTTTRIPSQAEYERRELDEARRQLDEVRRAPIADRKEAQEQFLEAMRDRPEVVGERVGWLLDGNYGYGSMHLAKRVLGSPRMNRVAALTQMVGAFEWQSPEDMTRAAWKKLSASEKKKLDGAVQRAIRSAEEEG